MWTFIFETTVNFYKVFFKASAKRNARTNPMKTESAKGQEKERAGEKLLMQINLSPEEKCF